MPLALEINRALFGGSPFEGFDTALYPSDIALDDDAPEIFDAIIGQLSPSLIIHVGCGTGLRVHQLLTRAVRRADASVICIDSWLGSADQWRLGPWREQARFRHGRAQLYEQFLANVIHAGLEERVVPLAMEFAQAATMLARMRIGDGPLAAPLVYLDGSADETSIKAALEAFWPKVCPGGVLLVGNFDNAHIGIIDTVDRFRDAEAPRMHQNGVIGTHWFAQRTLA